MQTIYSYLLLAGIVFTIPVILLSYGKQWLVALMPIYLITANVFAESFFDIHGIIQSLAVPIYCATFLVNNMIAEHFGKAEARKAIMVGFTGQIIFLILMVVITHSALLPEKVDIYKKTFKIIPRLVVGSMIAYIASQLTDAFLYYTFRQRTGERKLFVRNSASTIIAQFVDTTLLTYIAFWGLEPFGVNHTLLW